MRIGIPVYQGSVHIHDVPCRQENVQNLHERHLRIGVNRHYRSFEVDFHLVCVLIVIVIEYLEAGNDRVEIVA